MAATLHSAFITAHAKASLPNSGFDGFGRREVKSTRSQQHAWMSQDKDRRRGEILVWMVQGKDRRREEVLVCRSSAAEPKLASTGLGGVTEVDKESFWPLVEKATGENKLLVLDMYTQWCGPCKLMHPKVVQLSETYANDVVFAKLDCNQENKELAKELGVKTVPTFKVFKNGEIVAEVRGAKFEELVKAIENAL